MQLLRRGYGEIRQSVTFGYVVGGTFSALEPIGLFEDIQASHILVIGLCIHLVLERGMKTYREKRSEYGSLDMA